jgi:hypothetical protein
MLASPPAAASAASTLRRSANCLAAPSMYFNCSADHQGGAGPAQTGLQGCMVPMHVLYSCGTSQFKFN